MSNLTDQALQKIGRNVLYYQRIEWMLKRLISYSNIVVTTDKITGGNADPPSKKTLGLTIKDYFDTLFSSPDNSALDERNELYFSFSYHIGLTEEQLKPWRESCEQIVRDRNNLIHVQLGTFNQDDPDQCLDLIKELDEQLDRMRWFHNSLLGQVENVGRIRKEIAELLMKDENLLNALVKTDQDQPSS